MDEKKRCPNRALGWLLERLSLYLDDLLVISGGGCVIGAAWDGLGRAAGLTAAGLFLWALALLIVRARKRGGG